MAKLPGWSFMLVGIAMMGYSKFIEAKQPTANLTFFFWIGGALIAFGLLREITSRTKKKGEKELIGPPKQKEHVQHQLHPGGNQVHGVSNHATHQHVQPATHPSHPYERSHKNCPRCHQANTMHAKFCQSCGFQYY